MTHTVYLVGVPGSGKTTLLAELRRLCGWQHLATERLPVRHQMWLASDGATLVAELGGPHPGGFDGTDVLALDAQPRVVAWLADDPDPPEWLIGEGDRLATDGFFRACTEAGTLTVLHLVVPADVAQARLAARGSAQAPAWLAGRATKVARLVARWPTWQLDGTEAPAALAAQLAARLPWL